MTPAVSTGGVESMRVEYVTDAALPQPSVVVTVTTAEHVPAVDAVSVSAPGHASVADVAASAAASAAATVGWHAAIVPVVTTGGVESMRVEYVTDVALPQPSVVVTVTTAEQVPAVDAVSESAPGHASVADVAASAADSAAATVG